MTPPAAAQPSPRRGPSLGHEGDVAKLLDFCLVKDPHAADGGMTHDETITGTPLYMSPESLRSPDDVGPRSDVYSLGAVANFLVTGMPPFSGNTIFEICAAHLYSVPEPPSQQRDGACRPRSGDLALLGQGRRHALSERARAASGAVGLCGRHGLGRAAHHRAEFREHCVARGDAFIGDAATEPSSALQIDLDRRLRSKAPQ